MRVRYALVDAQDYIAECDLTEKEARKRYNALKENKRCSWAELIAEDEEDGGYMEVLCGFDNKDAHAIYKAEKAMEEVMAELFG